MWGKQLLTKYSPFFEGNNIFETMKNSLFGKIKHILNKLVEDNPEELSKYKLPKAIVIGNESTGKSSLLENITKCQIFPRHNLLCTKAPIRLVLNNGTPLYNVSYNSPEFDVAYTLCDKKDIYKYVQQIMDKLSDDTISEHEIVVEMNDYDLPCFEFFDLPGIRSYPPNMAEATMNLCRKYLESKDSIVLCVVPATVTRLTSCQSIALILEMKMQQNSILALTMADRLQLENVEDLLIKRILRTSDEIKDITFKDCVAVVNRLHTDKYSLSENDTTEQEWFNENIINGMPTDYKLYENKILENITIMKLLKKMDNLYTDFIQTNWKPKITSKINDDLNILNIELNMLGERFLSANVVDVLVKKFLIQEFNLSSHIISEYGDASTKQLAQITEYNDISKSISDTIKSNANYEKNTLILTIRKLFSQNYKNVNYDNYKLFKFTSALSHNLSLVDEYYDKDVNRISKQIKKTILMILTEDYLRGKTLIENFYINKIKESFDLLVLNNFFVKQVDCSQERSYEESDEFIAKRNSLISKITILENYKSNINNI